MDDYTTYKDSLKPYTTTIKEVVELLKNNSAKVNLNILEEVKFTILENSFLSQ